MHRILSYSKVLGEMQQARAESWLYNMKYEWSIWWQVARNGTMPVMFDGVRYDYRRAVE